MSAFPLLSAGLAAALMLAAAPAFAQSYDDDEDDYGPSRVARISDVSGDVSVLEPDSDDWESAYLNTPVPGKAR